MNKYSHFITSTIFSAFLVLFTLSCAGPGPYPVDPEITIHAPDGRTFYVPNVDEPLNIFISFPGGVAYGSPIFDIELINDENRVVFNRGGPPASGPLVIIGTQDAQQQTLSPPEMTTPGWYTVKVYGDTIWGESEPFRLSRIGPAMDDHALTVRFPAETAFHPGGSIHLTWHAWGDECDPASDSYTVMLFRNGSHGASHSQWVLDMNATGSDGDFIIPAEVPPDGRYFIRINDGPRCEGTSALIPIAP